MRHVLPNQEPEIPSRPRPTQPPHDRYPVPATNTTGGATSTTSSASWYALISSWSRSARVVGFMFTRRATGAWSSALLSSDRLRPCIVLPRFSRTPTGSMTPIARELTGGYPWGRGRGRIRPADRGRNRPRQNGNIRPSPLNQAVRREFLPRLLPYRAGERPLQLDAVLPRGGRSRLLSRLKFRSLHGS
jgi:hypothetical protein